MALLSAFFSYLVKFIIFCALASAGGFILGKKFRDKKER